MAKTTPVIQIKKTDIEKNRQTWAKVAKKYKWLTDPFYIQIWVNKKGEITDSVSFQGIQKDLVVSQSTDKLLKSSQYTII